MFEKDFKFTGKHATYVKFLVNNAEIFSRNIDVYMLGALVGIYYNKRGATDTTSKDDTSIPVSAFINEKPNCTFIYRLVMLLSNVDERENLIEHKLNKAFRDDCETNSEAKMKENMDLFHSYVLGGVEKIYEQYTTDIHGKEEYIQRMFEVIEDFRNTQSITNDCEINEDTLLKYI